MTRVRKLFYVGLAIKILALWFPGSTYMRDMFVPFLDEAVKHPLSNPWALSPANYFPYGSVLYLIMALPRAIVYWLGGSGLLGFGPVSWALIKGPLLVFDVILLRNLLRLGPGNEERILWFYWLNPIAFFISYVHGQLDIVLATFLVISLRHLGKGRIGESALAMAAATLCKATAFAVVPLMLAYLWNGHFRREALRRLSLWSGIYAATVCVGFMPLAAAGHILYATVSSPEAMRVFGLRVDLGQGEFVYIGLILVLTMILRLCLATRLTAQGLLFGAGQILAFIVLVTRPMPGWFFWFLPFSSLLFALYRSLPQILYAAFAAAYFIYVGLGGHGGSYELLSGLSLTLVQTLLLAIIVFTEITVLRHEASLTRRVRSIQIGLAGNSGAGKNHFTMLLRTLFGERHTLAVEGDDYHKWERGAPQWSEYTHLNPEANQLSRLTSHALRLQRGLSVSQPHYDHSVGRFTASRQMRPANAIVVQGLHALYPKGLRDSFDLKIFLKPDPRLLSYWKIKRDMQVRRHPIEQIQGALELRSEDALRFVHPQERFADWVVETLVSENFSVEQALKGEEPELHWRYTVWNELIFRDLADMVAKYGGCSIDLKVDTPDTGRMQIEIHGDPTPTAIATLARHFFGNLRHATRSYMPPIWSGGGDGLHQIFALALIDIANLRLGRVP